MDENLQELEDQLRQRKCLYCGALIKQYVVSGCMLPFEGKAQLAVEECAESGFPFTVMFFGRISWDELLRLTLSSTCKCGNITYWECNGDVWKLLTSRQMRDDGYGIAVIYARHPLSLLTGHLKEKTDADMLQSLLSSIEEHEANAS